MTIHQWLVFGGLIATFYLGFSVGMTHPDCHHPKGVQYDFHQQQ